MAALNSAAGLNVHIANPNGAKPPPKQPVKLQIYAASELYGKPLSQTPMVVTDMIPVGLTVLAGQPKRGKSWLALALALAVSQGRPFLGRETRQGAVLYLDIESREYRVQSRLSKLQPERWPENLLITHDAPPISQELYALLEDAVRQYKLTLIIIDTLGRVKAGAKTKSGRNENAYETDTGLFGEMQKWAQKHGVAVLAVHHMRKSSASANSDDYDWYERISGSNGLSGVCDAVIGLGGKRDDPTSTLNVSSRDFEAYKLCIRFQDGMWTLEGTGDPAQYAAERAYNTSATVRGVIALMRSRAEWRGSPAELVSAIIEEVREPLDLTAKICEGEIRFHTAALYDRAGLLVQTSRTGRRTTIRITDIRAETRQMEVSDYGQRGEEPPGAGEES